MLSFNRVLIIASLVSLQVSCRHAGPEAGSPLWPATEPYQQGYLKVSEQHELYYEVCGNPAGIPVMVLHGGPGGSADPGMRRYFNPEKFLAVLFDQRGAGRSKPFGELSENNTQALIADIEKLREFLHIERMILFGGSWGSTLALAYAEAHPDRVSGLILRGIFTATTAEIDHFYHGGAAVFYPDVYRQLMDSLPEPRQDSLPAYLSRLLASDDPKLVRKTANAWLRYEWLISDLRVNRREVEDWMQANDAYAFSAIENHYMAHRCFLEEGQLWKDLPRIVHLPCIIVNGRLDMPCPPVTAWRLNREWPGSKLVIVEDEGHFGPGIEKALVEAVRTFEEKR